MYRQKNHTKIQKMLLNNKGQTGKQIITENMSQQRTIYAVPVNTHQLKEYLKEYKPCNRKVR